MSTPGNLVVVDKTYALTIPAVGPTDGGTLIKFRDDGQSINTDRFVVPVGHTTFHLQLQCTLSSTTANRPTWVQVELVRFKVGGVDSTGKSRRSIIQPGTTTWADTFSIEEYVNETDGAFGWTVTHNGASAVTATTKIFKAFNVLANIIHRLGGVNILSA